MSGDRPRETSLVESLAPHLQERLAQILEDYLVELEQGTVPDAESLIREHPDLAEPLRAYLQSLDYLRRAAAGFDSPEGGSLTPAGLPDGRLGDFTILREIGRGGMGIVYEARQTSLDRRVALKVLPFAAVLDSKQITRFENEARAAARLQHPNIVPVFAVGCHQGVHYYAMQYIEGQSLDRTIHQFRQSAETRTGRGSQTKAVSGGRQRPASAKASCTNDVFLTSPSIQSCDYVRAVAELGVQAADALQHAHDCGIVHRDVKPSNLLLDKEGKLWVADFGLAMFQGDSKLTRTGDLVGTIRYMSPEQAAGRLGVVDQRADVYSLGITLYELLTLEPAVPCEDRQEFVRLIEHQEPRPPRRLNPAIPLDLETVVLKAVSKSPVHRFATARELADDLRRFLEGKPTLARRPTLIDRVGKWARRHKTAVRAAAAVMAVALVGLIVSTLMIATEQAKTERALVQSENDRKRAEEHFDQALEVVDHLGLLYAQQLGKIPGAEPLRRQLLGETLDYYEGFITLVGDEAGLRDRVALTELKAGRINELLGDTEAALAAYQRAGNILGGLAEKVPENDQYRADLAICHNNMGLLRGRLHQAIPAKTALQTAISIQEKLVEKHPENAEFQSDLAQSYGNLGQLLAEADQAAEADRMYAKSAGILQAVAQRHPHEPKYLSDLAVTYNNLSLLHGKNNPAKAQRWCREALAIQQKLVDAEPGEVTRLGDLALFLNNLGALQRRLGQTDEAVAAYGRAVAIQEQLVRKSPTMVQYRRDLAVSHNNLGQVYSSSSRSDEAVASFGRARTILEQLAGDYPNRLDYRSILGGVLNNQGMAREQLNQPDDAMDVYRQAIEHQRFALEHAPEVREFREFLSKHYVNYARVLRATGDFDEATRIALARKELWAVDPQRLFSVATELARTAKAVSVAVEKGSPGAAALRQRLSDLTLSTLREAIAAGFDRPEQIANDADLQAVQNCPEFAALLDELAGTRVPSRGT
ncbi:MAG: serine/threonine protein kinase [Pirellulales bacterium]|nr:serine/threonine protein kinase [Pirellulales bacterium]